MENKAIFQFKSYQVVLSHLEVKNFSPETCQQATVNFNTSHSDIENDGNDIYVKLDSSIKGPDDSFAIEVSVVGIFSFEEECTTEEKKMLVEINAPAILFPYVRAHISALTSISGIPPIILPTINFAQMNQKK